MLWGTELLGAAVQQQSTDEGIPWHSSGDPEDQSGSPWRLDWVRNRIQGLRNTSQLWHFLCVGLAGLAKAFT